MPSRIVEADLDQIKDNPYRDYRNYPIDRKQVDRLKASFDDTGGIWHAIPARPGPDAGTYELCFGHHRLFAAKELGHKTIMLEVGDHDEDDMILMMVTENGTQQRDSAAATVDSVAAITRRLAYVVLRARLHSELPSWVPRILGTQDALNSARGKLVNGKGIGEDLIHGYAPKGTLPLDAIRSAIQTLKATDGYQRIIESVTQQVHDEMAVEEAERERLEEEALAVAAESERKEREKAEAAELAAAERQRREEERKEVARLAAEEAEKRQREAIARREADKAERERIKAEEQRDRQERAAARLAKMEQEKAERVAQKALRDHEREEKEAAALAERERQTAERERREKELLDLEARNVRASPLMDGAVIPYFRNHYCLSQFREIVTKHNHLFPVDGQLEHVKAMCKMFKKDKHKPAAENLTAQFVAKYLNGFVHESYEGKKKDEALLKSLAQSFDDERQKFVKGTNWVQSAVNGMIKLIEQGAPVPMFFEEQLRMAEEKTTGEITRLRKATGFVRGRTQIEGRAKRASVIDGLIEHVPTVEKMDG